MASIQSFADSHGLGQPLARFSSRGSMGNSLTLGGIGFLVAVLSLLLLLADILGPIAVLALITGAGIFLVSAVEVVRLLALGAQNVLVFEEGFLSLKGKDASPEVVRWDNVDTVMQDIYTYRVNFIPVIRRHTYRIRTRDGRDLVYKRTLEGIEEFGKILQTQVAQRQLPAALDKLRSGGTLSFGPVGITRQGLVKGDIVLPWENVKRVRVANGQIIVRQEGKAFAWRNTPASKVPNLYLFLTIIDRAVGLS